MGPVVFVVSEGLDQPLTAPEVRPRTKKRCREKKTIIGSTMEMKAPAVSNS